MANFPVRSFMFAPVGANFARGPDHRVQRHIMVVDDPPLNHDRYAPVLVNPPVPDHRKEFWLAEVCRINREDLELEVLDDFVYLIGIGCIALADAVIREFLIREGPQALTDDSTYTLTPHDEGLNMRMPAFEYEVWIMFLVFPLDYQTENCVHKAVSNFGKLLMWPRPRYKKARVLVEVHIKDVGEVPHSLIVTRLGMLPGLGRSWSVPVYVLNGRHTIPHLVGTEEDPPQLNASPHPYELPYYALMQQARLDALEQQRIQNEAAWNGDAPAAPEIQNNGWGVWHVIPPPYTGFSFRRFFEYDGPSLMDGVPQENNIRDNLSDVWSEYSEVEAAAENFFNGVTNAHLNFVRAGGVSSSVVVFSEAGLLLWIGRMLKLIYTPQIMAVPEVNGVPYPANPFAVIKCQLEQFCGSVLQAIRPERVDLNSNFLSVWEQGFSLDRHVALAAGLFALCESQGSPDVSPENSNTLPPLVSVVGQIPGSEAQPVGSFEIPRPSVLAPMLQTETVRGASSVPNFSSSQVTATCNRGKQLMPLDTTQVRRSTLSNKYDGFKVSQPKDIRVTKSKVKPRIKPSVSLPVTGSSEDNVTNLMQDTPVPVLQPMGGICGVPTQDLSPKKLLASL